LPESLPKKVRPLVDDYFKLVLERNLAASDRKLEEIRQALKDGAWEQGYLNALEGVLITQRTSDTRYVYLSRIDLKNPKKVEEARRSFLAEARNTLEGEFDRGFFSAWAELLKMVKASLEGKEKEDAKTLDNFIEE